MSFDLNGMLEQYISQPQEVEPKQATDDFEKLKTNLPQETLAKGVVAALQSEKTLPFAALIRQFFEHGNSDQKADVVNELLRSLNPETLATIAGGIFSKLTRSNGSGPTVTPEVVDGIDPKSVEEIAAHAEQTNPGIIDTMGELYARHSSLIKSLGGAALAVVLSRIAQEKSQ
jgi:hypothetical protein